MENHYKYYASRTNRIKPVTRTKVKKNKPWDIFESYTSKIKTVAEAIGFFSTILTVLSAAFGAFVLFAYFSRVTSVTGYYVPFPPIDATFLSLLVFIFVSVVFFMVLLCVLFLGSVLMMNINRALLEKVVPDLYFDQFKFRRENPKNSELQFWQHRGRGSLQYFISYIPVFLIMLAAFMQINMGKDFDASIIYKWAPIGVGFWLVFLVADYRISFIEGIFIIGYGLWANFIYLLGLTMFGLLGGHMAGGLPNSSEKIQESYLLYTILCFVIVNFILGIQAVNWKTAGVIYLAIFFVILNFGPGPSYIGAVSLRFIGIGGGIPVSVQLRPIPNVSRASENVFGCLIMNAGNQVVLQIAKPNKEKGNLNHVCIPHQRFWTVDERNAADKGKYGALGEIEVYSKTDILRIRNGSDPNPSSE